MRRAAAITVAISVLGLCELVSACGGRGATVTTGGAVFDISPEILASPRSDTLIDLGTVREGEIVRFNARLRNSGTEPLVIKSIDTSCGCTSVEYETRPIGPGKSGGFSFRFDSSGFWGTQLKLIEINTSFSPRSYKVLVQAKVENDNFL